MLKKKRFIQQIYVLMPLLVSLLIIPYVQVSSQTSAVNDLESIVEISKAQENVYPDAYVLEKYRSDVASIKCIYNDFEFKLINLEYICTYSEEIDAIVGQYIQNIYGAIYNKEQIELLVGTWKEASYLLVARWRCHYMGDNSGIHSFSIIGNDGSILYDTFLAGIPIDIHELRYSDINKNNHNINMVADSGINYVDEATVYYGLHIVDPFGSADFHWMVTASASIDPYIDPSVNDATLTLKIEPIRCYITNPVGIIPAGLPIVYFGDEGTVGGIGVPSVPFLSDIQINGSYDYFGECLFNGSFHNGFTSTELNVGFSLGFIGGISIAPSNPNSPILFEIADADGRHIEMHDIVWPNPLAGRFEGVFWEDAYNGYVRVSNLKVKTGDSGSELGTISVTIPVQCARTYWSIAPFLIPEGEAGTLSLQSEYIRGHRVPQPSISISSSATTMIVGETATITATVTNNSDYVDLGPTGHVEIDLSSLMGKLEVQGNSSISFTAIAPKESIQFQFILQAKEAGHPQPSANCTGQWGFPVGPREFASSAGLLQSIEIKPVHSLSTPNTPSGPTQRTVQESGTYSTSGSSCTWGHSVQYRFDWGDGTYSDWSSVASAAHDWDTADTYTVKAQARCATDNSVVSDWSGGLSIVISNEPNELTFTFAAMANPIIPGNVDLFFKPSRVLQSPPRIIVEDRVLQARTIITEEGYFYVCDFYTSTPGEYTGTCTGTDLDGVIGILNFTFAVRHSHSGTIGASNVATNVMTTGSYR